FHRQIQIAGQGLRNHANGPPHRLRIRRHIMPRHPRRSRRDRNQGRHHPDQRRFPRPIRPQQPENFPLLHRKRNVVYRRELAISFHDVFHFNSIRSVRCNVATQAQFRRRNTHAVRGVPVSLVHALTHGVYPGTLEACTIPSSAAADSLTPPPSSRAHTPPSDCPASPSTQSSVYPAFDAPHPAASRNPLPPLYKKLFPESASLPAAAPAACLPVQCDRRPSPES